MTVEQLIERLKQLPMDMDVVMSCDFQQGFQIESIEIRHSLVQNKDNVVLRDHE